MIYEFSPKQDLHGYDKPWAPGEGKNLWDGNASYSGESAKFMIGTGGTLAGAYAIELPSAEYIVSFKSNVTGSHSIRLFKSDGTYFTASTSAMAIGLNQYTIDCTDDVVGVVVYMNASNFIITEFMIRLSSETDSSYAPYSNICPPEGYNIWDPVEEQMIPVYSGYVDAEARKLYLHPVYEEYDGEELVGPWMSSLDEYTEEGTPTTGAFVVDFGGELTEYDITDFMLQTLLDSLGIRRFITSGATLLNSLMDQAQGRVRSEEELLNLSMPIHVIAIGKELPTNLVIKKPVSDVLPVLPGNTKI